MPGTRPGMTRSITKNWSGGANRLLLPLRPFDAFDDQPLGVVGIAPAQHLDPFAGFEILVVLEEVLDLLQRDVGKVVVVLHLVIALRQFRRRPTGYAG